MDRPPLLVLIAVVVPITMGLCLAFAVMWLQVQRLDAVLFAQDFEFTMVASVALTFTGLLVLVFGFGPEHCNRCTKRVLWHKVTVKDYPHRHYDTNDWTGEVYEHIPTLVYHRSCYLRNKRNELTV